MALGDDGDIVRGLGFVSMYSAWIEEDVDDILRLLSSVSTYGEKEQRWPVSRKLVHAAKVVRSLNSNELDHLPEALEYAVKLMDRRNEYIHGRIYAGQNRIDYIQGGRPNSPTKPVTSAELYEFANELLAFRGSLIGPQLFRLPRAIRGRRDDAS